MTGGIQKGGKIAEAYHPNGTFYCRLPDLELKRQGHEQVDLVICGGDKEKDNLNNFHTLGGLNKCSCLEGNHWVTTHTLMKARNTFAASFAMWKSSKGYSVIGGVCCDYNEDGSLKGCDNGDGATYCDHTVELLDEELSLTKPFFKLSHE